VRTSWLSIENIIRGKVVASPKSGPWWVLWVRVLPVTHLCIKSVLAMH
jgi:hypothetical protein